MATSMAAPAIGQQRVGSDGRLLERNLQVGSGGYNSPRVRNTYGRYADALVTGNAGGLHNFRGNLDYRAAGEFSGRTALDDTFGFRQRSVAPIRLPRPGIDTAPGPGAVLGRPGLDQRAYRGGWLVVRSGGGATIGDVTGQSPRYDLGTPVRRDDAVSARLGGGDQRRRDQDLASTRLDAEGANGQLGRRVQITASPLLGVRVAPVPMDRVQVAPTASPVEPAVEDSADRVAASALEITALGQGSDPRGRRFSGHTHG
ncbi:MAG: hypothetical protein OER86_10355, partial [Phycisphaerae bacterium]|nr:hypothetical protein [Phycisphaerae bacterium]